MKRTRKIFLLVLAGLIGLCLVSAGVSFLSNLTLPKAPETTDRLSQLDKERLAEAIALRWAEGEAVWPGFGQIQVPLIIWNRDYSFMVGLTEPPPGWESTPGDDFQGQPYFRQKSVEPQNFAVPVGAGWAASMATKSETDRFLIGVFRDFLPPVIESIFPYRLMIQPSEVQISAVAHETFHVFQQINTPERLSAAEAAHKHGDDYWQADPAMSEDWQKEIDLLYRAVRAEDDQHAFDLARQFLAQRQSRREKARLSSELADYERQLEWEEGLAKYIELAIWQAAYADPEYRPILTGDPDFKGYRTFPQRLKQELDQMRRQAKQEGEARFYYTGMAQARLLDRLSPGWKAQALAEGVWVEELLEEAIR